MEVGNEEERTRGGKKESGTTNISLDEVERGHILMTYSMERLFKSSESLHYTSSLHSASTMYSAVSPFPTPLDTLTPYLPLTLGSSLVSVSLVSPLAVVIRGSGVLMGCPSLLHSTVARGLPWSYLTVIVCEAPLVSLMLGLSGWLVILGASVRGEENGGGK